MTCMGSMVRLQLAIGFLLLTGCAVPPANDAVGASAYAVGDRGRVSFDEIVVSLPFRGASGPYQNLHLFLAAVVNPREPKWLHPAEVEAILRRVEARAAAQLSESLSKLGEQSLESTPRLRKKAIDETQAIVDELLRAWKDGDKYRVEIIVANLYWTDASAGRGPARTGW